MLSYKKLFGIVLATIILSFITLMVVVVADMRRTGIENAEQKAYIAAQLVEDGLTMMMTNMIMDNRESFLNKISKTKNIEDIWLTRAPSVIAQYGKGLNNEVPRDEMDNQVIKEGKPSQKFVETISTAKLRVTVPYVATTHGNIDCLSCHKAAEGETLGTISMVFDVSQMRNDSLAAFGYMLLVSIFIIVLIVVVLNRTLNPFLNIFSSINNVMQAAKDGDFSQRVSTEDTNADGKKVAGWINDFFDDLEATLTKIQKNIKKLFNVSQETHNDPLRETEEIIAELANIYNLKKAVEMDDNKAIIYERLGFSLQECLGLKNFSIIEADKSTSKTKVVFSCQDNPTALPITTRAFRITQPVFSTQFKRISETCSNISEHYACLPYRVDKNTDFMIHAICENDEEVTRIEKIQSKIDNFIYIIKADIVGKNLNEILHRSSITDKLTGLHNRAYLDGYIETAASQALRNNISLGLLMIDIDFFKKVNDTYGHDVGDNAIKALSSTIKSSIRESDLAFRYGGEEFVVILYGCEPQNIKELAEKIRTNFEKVTIQAGGTKSFTKTISIGCANFPKDSTAIWSCIKYSDIALYKAKNTGRNKVVVFDYTMLDEGEKATYKPTSNDYKELNKKFVAMRSENHANLIDLNNIKDDKKLESLDDENLKDKTKEPDEMKLKIDKIKGILDEYAM